MQLGGVPSRRHILGLSSQSSECVPEPQNLGPVSTRIAPTVGASPPEKRLGLTQWARFLSFLISVPGFKSMCNACGSHGDVGWCILGGLHPARCRLDPKPSTLSQVLN